MSVYPFSHAYITTTICALSRNLQIGISAIKCAEITFDHVKPKMFLNVGTNVVCFHMFLSLVLVLLHLIYVPCPVARYVNKCFRSSHLLDLFN